MLGSIRRRAAQIVFSTVVACCLPLAASAATINVILSDMDVSYSGSTSGGVLFDSMGGVAGGGMNPIMADEISTAVFEVDGNPVGTLPIAAEEIYGDLRLINVGPTLAKNVFLPSVGANGGGFGFDLFTSSGFELRLGLTSVSLFINNNVFFFTGQANVLPGQNLPFGLQFDETQPVQFSYTATLPAVQAGATTNSAMSSGAFTISGIAIPEPATYAMLCSGLLAVGVGMVWRPRRPALSMAPVRHN
jgi:hypothetical protein